jgi:hypothetical protein
MSLMEIDTGHSLGFPGSLDATTVGVRTDSGYRFGSFNGGAFIEPLAIIAINWADIDGFSLGGNKVSFNDDATPTITKPPWSRPAPPPCSRMTSKMCGARCQAE